MDAPACTIELKWIGDGEPQQLSHHVNIIGVKKPAIATFFTYATALQLFVSYVVLYVCIDMLVTHVYTHLYICTNTVSTNTVPDTPPGATPTVQDVTASHDEHSEQGDSVHNSYAVCSLTSININHRVSYANIHVSGTKLHINQSESHQECPSMISHHTSYLGLQIQCVWWPRSESFDNLAVRGSSCA